MEKWVFIKGHIEKLSLSKFLTEQEVNTGMQTTFPRNLNIAGSGYSRNTAQARSWPRSANGAPGTCQRHGQKWGAAHSELSCGSISEHTLTLSASGHSTWQNKEKHDPLTVYHWTTSEISYEEIDIQGGTRENQFQSWMFLQQIS